MDYRVLRGLSTPFFIAGIFLLLLVLVFGKIIRGTTGWINLGLFNLQPVEPFKLVIAISLAKYFSLNVKTIRSAKHIFVSAVSVFVPVVLILAQPDLGSSLMIIGVWIGILLLSGVRKSYLGILVIVCLLISVLSWNFLLKSYQKERIEVLLNPASDPLGAGYNAFQSTVAVGSGGLWGKGLGHGSQSQLNFLPEKHTDFIFAVLAEELGLGGAVFVLALLTILFLRLFSIARASRDNFGKLLVSGFIIAIFVQSVINIGMNIGLAPVAGIPLPLLSYGGSSLITVLAALGISESVFRKTGRQLTNFP